jgi:uncharacterized protein YceH (UPF0502 family)
MEDIDAVLKNAAPGDAVAIGVRSERGARIVNVVLGKRSDEPVAATPVEVVEVPKVEPKPVAPRRDRAAGDRDLEAELQALRAELAELRKQIEALKRQKGRE